MSDSKAEKQRLLSLLLDAVKQCQIRFGGRQELATESDARVTNLCARYEAVLQHGLRRLQSNRVSAFRNVASGFASGTISTTETIQVFWACIKTFLSRHECERYMFLQHVTTDVGRGRAWLRSALNERFLERNLLSVLFNDQRLDEFYEDWALMRDAELSSMLPTMAAGLGSILFAIAIDKAELDSLPLHMTPCGFSTNEFVRNDPEPVLSTDLKHRPESEAVKKVKKRRRRPQTNVVFLGGDEEHRDDEAKTSWDHVERGFASGSSCGSTASPSLRSNFDARSTTSDRGPEDSPVLPRRSNASPVPLSSSLPNKSFIASLSFAESPPRRPSHMLTPVTEPGIGELIPVFDADSVSVGGCENSDFSPAEASSRKGSKEVPNDDISSMSPDELKKSLMSVLARNSELESEVDRLRKETGEAKSELSSVASEMLDLQRRLSEKNEKAELKMTSLIRENELLKHQLKKYVGAVRLLRNRDSPVKYESGTEELLNSLETSPSCLPVVASSESLKTLPESYHEASQYEQKLIQVAEMHGELMEFNERLQRYLRSREAVITRLREELIDLRGPLPPEDEDDDDAASSTSDLDSSSLSAASRVLINIWIPSAFLTGRGADCHHVYQVYIRIRDDEWNVFRRYSQFYALHKSLCKKNPILNSFDFPPKKAIGNRDASFVEERRRKLQHYVRCVVNFTVQNNPSLGSQPDKQTLVQCLPFFQEHANLEQKKSRSTSRRSFFGRRNDRVPSSSNLIAASQPIYTGL